MLNLKIELSSKFPCMQTNKIKGVLGNDMKKTNEKDNMNGSSISLQQKHLRNCSFLASESRGVCVCVRARVYFILLR